MQYFFSIEYFTVFGENIEIVCFNEKKSKTFPMEYHKNGIWKIHFNTLEDFSHYYYQVNNTGSEIISKEWKERKIPIFEDKMPFKKLLINDFWNKANLPENYLNNKFFACKNQKYHSISFKKTYTHHIKLKAFLPTGYSFCILGNCTELGNWNPEKFEILTQTDFNTFEIKVNLAKIKHVIQYKFGLVDNSTHEFYQIENGENRILYPNTENDTLLINNEIYYKYHTNNLPKVAGVAVPVFSIRTENSFGIGEFSDLITFGNWAEKVGFSLIQVLPINDTIATHTWTDSYPYAAISVYALNPVYISIKNLPFKLNEVLENEYKEVEINLNNNEFVNWNSVLEYKFKYLHFIFEENSSTILKDKQYHLFLDDNRSWIEDYAVFCTLRDTYKTANFNKWTALKKYNKKTIKSYFVSTHKHFKDVHFHCFIQYYLHKQLMESIDFLHAKNIKLKGDLPIGIYRFSVEAWKEPKLFGMDFQAGAPPDDFAVLGQNWEFPTYNWEEMKKDNYQWWKNRFGALAKYFDAMRIDHILGFFRIWRMPIDAVQGILGYFYPAIPITKEEFAARGIPFYEDRFCKPFVNREILKDLFDDQSDVIFNEYFEEVNSIIQFKQQYDNQRKIVNSFSDKDNLTLGENLLKISANVLFLIEHTETGKVYHPRFNLKQTWAFQYLPFDIQQKINDLYVDYFFKRQDSLWKNAAMEKLPAIMQSSDMLLCGEDLGLVPDCVPKVMNDLGILSLQVQRMPSENIPFYNPEIAPYLSVVTPATHDTSTVRQWWEEDKNLTSNYFYNQLKFNGEVPEHCTKEIMKTIIEQHLHSPAMFAVCPIQEFLALTNETMNQKIDNERINIPSVFPHEWKYRIHVPIENLLKNDTFNHEVKEIIELSKRMI